MTTVTKESQLANMLRTCSEALKQVTAERNKLAAELKSLRDSGVELPEPVVTLKKGDSEIIPEGTKLFTEHNTRDYGDRRAMAERERAARVCEASCWSDNIDVWQSMTKKEVATRSMLVCAEAIRKGE